MTLAVDPARAGHVPRHVPGSPIHTAKARAVLVARARRVWQIAGSVDEGGHPLAPPALAGVLASLLLAPIVPPGREPSLVGSARESG